LHARADPTSDAIVRRELRPAVPDPRDRVREPVQPVSDGRRMWRRPFVPWLTTDD